MLRGRSPLLSFAIVIGALLALRATYVMITGSPHGAWPFVFKNTDLILYSYFETPEAMKNFDFFMRHAMHDKADFLFILNGEYDIDISSIDTQHNVRIVEDRKSVV